MSRTLPPYTNTEKQHLLDAIQSLSYQETPNILYVYNTTILIYSWFAINNVKRVISSDFLKIKNN